MIEKTKIMKLSEYNSTLNKYRTSLDDVSDLTNDDIIGIYLADAENVDQYDIAVNKVIREKRVNGDVKIEYTLYNE